MKLKLSCPEGWTYVSWQRCILVDAETGEYASLAVKTIGSLIVREDQFQLFSSEHGKCFFVESGESATLEGLAEAFSELLGIEIEVEQ